MYVAPALASKLVLVGIPLCTGGICTRSFGYTRFHLIYNAFVDAVYVGPMLSLFSLAIACAGFEYATYNDPEDLKRVVKRINRRGKIRSFFGKPRRAVAAIMMEVLQVRRI